MIETFSHAIMSLLTHSYLKFALCFLWLYMLHGVVQLLVKMESIHFMSPKARAGAFAHFSKRLQDQQELKNDDSLTITKSDLT